MTDSKRITLDLNEGDMTIVFTLGPNSEGTTWGVTDLTFHANHPVPIDRIGQVMSLMCNGACDAYLRGIVDEILREV